ncbi:AAA family ATPase [Streptomyces afghaniensis]|uniref:AAA family ATPase n=1 Tax=Streptomyces afghaniensis TaxID=66865 RepID=UPI0027854418|nr:AAA family ATPase [Streptomyces afghaniensis]MDQ1019809.1 WD40 repeat protein [Streptomyces afghaniensis]
MSGTEPRRFLIATAISHYPNAPAELEWDRPGLVEARRKVVELFSGTLGYTHVSDLGLNPTKNQLLREIREFCRAPDRRADDVVAVYVAGHGEVLDNGDYVLLTADTEPDDLYDALLPGTLARKILAGTKVRRLLLMLDTCFSGQGGNELLAAMARLKNDWREGESGLAVITSAQPRELAQTGAFPDLLTEAVTSLATAGYSPPLLALDAVVNATRTNPKRPDFQHIGLEIIGLTGEIPPFLPNTKHNSGLSHTDMALQQAAEWDQQAKRRDVEFRTRLLRRAMGHSDPHRDGWWFSGRHRALQDITEWLDDLPATRTSLVVTGDPGSGKTAVLGLLAAVSDPEYRNTVPLASLGLRDGQLPRPRAIGTAVYAQSLTDQQVLRAVAAALRLPPADSVADLLNHLNARPAPERPHIVLIDGLDEAATPSTLCAQVLRPLVELAAPHLRLLLGTRPHLCPALGVDRDEHIDLDAPYYADPRAVLVYTVRNLLDAHPDSPYLDCSNDVRIGVAQAVAAAAGHCFLVARITAGTLAATPDLPDPHDPDWRRSLPSAAADAMHRDLHQRFGEDAARVLDLLRPLAYAEGQGLPWEDIWAPLASELAGVRYTNEDIYRLRRDAGAYVVEAVEDGRSVYRLYHESMAEYLRRGQDAERVHRGFTVVLRRVVPYHLDGSRDWGRAHPYALRHLVTHAVAAGLLDMLLADAEYLVHAECDPLAPHLLRAESDLARLHAAIYLISLDVHRGLDAASRRQVLAVNAARFNVPTVLEAFNSQSARRAWKPVAASGWQVSANMQGALVGHTAPVDGVACTVLNGRPVAVTASRDDTVRIWDLTTGRPLGEPLSGHTDSVHAVVCTELDGRPVTVTGSKDKTVRIWDLTTGRPVGEPLRGHTDSVEELACTELDGRPVAVTGSEDRTVRIWDLTTGRPVGEPLAVKGHPTSLACAVVRGRPIVVVSAIGEGLFIWDLVSQRKLPRLSGDRALWLLAVGCTRLDDRPVAVGHARDGTMHLWDLESGLHLAEWQGHDDWAFSLVCAELDGRPVALVSHQDSTVRTWDLTTRQQVGPPLKGHNSGVLSVTCSSLSGQLVAVTGSFDGTVRVWDLSPRQVAGEPVIGHTNLVTSLGLSSLDARPVLVTGSDDSTVRVWDLVTGLPEGEPMTGHAEGVRSLVCTMLADRPVAISGGDMDYTVRTWDLLSRRPAASPIQLDFESVAQVACTVLDGRPIVVGTTLKANVRVWDLATGEEVYPPLEGHSTWVSVVACTMLDGRPVAVTASPADKTVRVWDLARGRALGAPAPGFVQGPIACTTLGDRPVVLFASEDHAIRVRDLRTHQDVGPAMTGHAGFVNTLVCAELDGRPVAVTGSSDNTVRIWDLRSFSVVDVIHVPGRCAAVALHENGLLACAFGSDIAVFSRE